MIFGNSNKSAAEESSGGKKLRVNAATCDARGLTEKTLEQYESVTINAAAVVVSEHSSELLSRYNVTMNCASVIAAPDNAKVSTKNGAFTISAAEAPVDPMVLVVNGSLNIEADSQQALKHYVTIIVNGSARYPRSVSPLLGMMSVNGSVEVYPDGAVILKSSTEIDAVFVARSRSKLYYSSGTVVLTDPSLNIAPLLQNGVSFEAKRAVICSSQLAGACAMFPEATEITAVPDGCHFVKGAAELDEALLRKYGDMLYVSGDLSIPAESAPLLPRIRYLKVKGNVRLPNSVVNAFYAMKAEYGGVKLIKGKEINDRTSVRIDRSMLERCTDGVYVNDCVSVILDDELTPEIILERLKIEDCVSIICTEKQRSAVEAVSEDCVQINDVVSTKSGGIMDIVAGIKELSGDKNTRTINAADYKF